MDIIVKHYGVIDLSDEMVISDPCYDNDCQGFRLKTALDSQGEHLFDVYVGFLKEDLRPAYLSVNLIDEGFEDTAMRYKGCCYVDSGTMGIYPAKIFDKIREDSKVHDEWYKRNICNGKYVPFFIDDEESFITPSGYGDGAYPLSIDFDSDGKIYRIVINFIEPNKDDEYEIVDMISPETDIEDYKKSNGVYEEVDNLKRMIFELEKNLIYEAVLSKIKSLPPTLESLYTTIHDEFMNEVAIIELQFPDKELYKPIDDVEWYDDFRDDLCETIAYGVMEKFLPDLYAEIERVYPSWDLELFYKLKDSWNSHSNINNIIKLFL